MCMEYDEKATKRLRKRMEQKGGTLTCWKVWRQWADRTIESIWYGRRAGGQICNAGVVWSNRAAKQRGEHERSVTAGIHVFPSKAVAQQYAQCSGFRIVVPVTCLLRDLVGAGFNCGETTEPTAVFTKVRLLKKDFDAAMAGGSDG